MGYFCGYIRQIYFHYLKKVSSNTSRFFFLHDRSGRHCAEIRPVSKLQLAVRACVVRSLEKKIGERGACVEQECERFGHGPRHAATRSSTQAHSSCRPSSSSTVSLCTRWRSGRVCVKSPVSVDSAFESWRVVAVVPRPVQKT